MKMSQILTKYNKSNQGTNGLMVRDSHWYAIGALIGFIVLSNMITLNISNSNNVYAASSSITVTIDDSTIDLNVAPTGQGAFSKSSVSTIGVSTTNYTGYTLSIAAQEGDNPTALVNGSSSLASIESALTESQFKALDATSYNNMWGYLPSNLCTTTTTEGVTSTTCTTNTSFLPSPTTDGDTLDITSAANTTVNEYELTLGARVDTTAAMGSYSNTFVIYATANAIPYTIIFDDNVVGSMPTDINDEATSTTVTLPSNVPTREGYTFLGWCSVVPTTTNGVDACTGGTTYSASGTLTLDQTGGSNDYHLYAMWSQTLKTIANSTYLQEVNSCPASVPTETTYTLRDSRDEQDYTVAKLKDGKCWMTKNLDLAGGTTLTANNTDMDTSWTLPTTNGFQSNNRLPVSSTTGFNDANGAYLYNSNNTTCTSSSPCYSYYSWATATLGSGSSITVNNTDAPYSICPKGWRLPTSRSSTSDVGNSDFWHLAVAYGVDYNGLKENIGTFYDNAGPNTEANFLQPGYYVDSEFYSGGSGGWYWSSTSGGRDIARTFYFTSTSTSSANVYFSGHGWSIRCILK